MFRDKQTLAFVKCESSCAVEKSYERMECLLFILAMRYTLTSTKESSGVCTKRREEKIIWISHRLLFCLFFLDLRARKILKWFVFFHDVFIALTFQWDFSELINRFWYYDLWENLKVSSFKVEEWNEDFNHFAKGFEFLSRRVEKDFCFENVFLSHDNLMHFHGLWFTYWKYINLSFLRKINCTDQAWIW